MNWAWASSLDHIWRSPTFPMWLTLAAAGFFGIVVLITLLRAEKSVANGALTVITLLAIGVAVAATLRGFGPSGPTASAETRAVATASAALPQLACIDDLAGDAVLNGPREKALFGSAESTASAVAYAASQISRLTGSGDVAVMTKVPVPNCWRCRRRRTRPLRADGLCADGARPLHAVVLRGISRALRPSSDRGQHGRARLREPDHALFGLLERAAAGTRLVAALPSSGPTGKPGHFVGGFHPAGQHHDPLSPAARPRKRRPRRPAPVQLAPVPAPRPRRQPPRRLRPPALAAAKKPPAPKRTPAAPVQISPAPTASSTAPAATTE